MPGTAVAFKNGLPAAVFERQGKVLRLPETEKLQGGEAQGGEVQDAVSGDSIPAEGILQGDVMYEALALFAEEFRRGRIFPGRKRILVKEYPACAAQALAAGGFIHEMQDYVLYR